jgi:methionine-rich copper-binding protein CopC
MSISAWRRRNTIWAFRTVLGAVFFSMSILFGGLAEAGPLHALDSTPVAEAIIRAGHAEYMVRFDGLVDHAASQIRITQSGHVIQTLPALLNAAPSVLYASGEAPAPGQYMLHWEARSSTDGTLSDGDIRFTVVP